MTTTAILAIVLISDTQTGKAAAANTAFARLEASANDTMDVDFTSADQTVTVDQYQTHIRFRCINVTTPRTLTLQAVKREVTLRSSSSNTAAITVTLGTATLTLYPGQMIKIYTDGTANGLERINRPDFEPEVTYTADHTLGMADRGAVINMNKATAINLTVPLNATTAFEIGQVFKIYQGGAGQLTLVATGGVTINTPRSLTARAQWSEVTLKKTGTDTWRVSGDLT